MMYGAACSPDGRCTSRRTESSLPKRPAPPPLQSRLVRGQRPRPLAVDPDGRITAFSVGPYGTYPPPALKAKPKAVCDVAVAEAARFGPSRGRNRGWADRRRLCQRQGIHMILKLRRDGPSSTWQGEGQTRARTTNGRTRKSRAIATAPASRRSLKPPGASRSTSMATCSWPTWATVRFAGSIVPEKFITVQKGCYADPGDKEDRRKRINHTHVAADPQGRPSWGVVRGAFRGHLQQRPPLPS